MSQCSVAQEPQRGPRPPPALPGECQHRTRLSLVGRTRTRPGKPHGGVEAVAPNLEPVEFRIALLCLFRRPVVYAAAHGPSSPAGPNSKPSKLVICFVQGHGARARQTKRERSSPSTGPTPASRREGPGGWPQTAGGLRPGPRCLRTTPRSRKRPGAVQELRSGLDPKRRQSSELAVSPTWPGDGDAGGNGCFQPCPARRKPFHHREANGTSSDSSAADCLARSRSRSSSAGGAARPDR